jgi:hypothetical protein
VESSGRIAKRQRRGEGSGVGEGVVENAKGDEDGFVSWKEQVQNMSRDEFEAFLKARAEEILEKAAKTVIEELADKVVGETDEGAQEVESLEDGELAEKGKEVEMEERLLEAATVPEASKAQVRASPRLQRSRNEHTLAKAEGRAARRNPEFSEGIPSSAPFCSVNRDLAIDCLQQLGFNLGNSSLKKDFILDDLLGSGAGGSRGGGL